MTQSTEIKHIECLCSEKFRTAEDYRDHLPCPAAETAWKAQAAFEALKKYGFEYKNRVWVPPVNEAAHRARMLRYGLEQIFALAAETLHEVGGDPVPRDARYANPVKLDTEDGTLPDTRRRAFSLREQDKSDPKDNESLNDYIYRSWVERGGCRWRRDEDGRHCMQHAGHTDPHVFEIKISYET